MNFKFKTLGALVLCGLISSPAMADVNFAVALRGGTFGYGADFDVGLTKSVNVRLGYNTFSLSRTVDDTDATYDGTFKIGAASAIFDWHVFNGGFRLSAGAVQKGPKIDVVGVPSASSTITIGGNPYSTQTQIAKVNGTIKLGNSTAPYLGIGWGNTLDEENRVTFLFDIGAIKTGTAKATLTATCSNTLASDTCAALQTQIAPDINTEITNLEDKAKKYQWYPVINLGLGVRF